MESSILFHKLVKVVDAEGIKNEKTCTLDLPVEIRKVTSKLESQNLSPETYDPNPENMFAQTTDLNNKLNLHFG